MRLVLLAFAMGCAALQVQGTLPDVSLVALVAAAALAVALGMSWLRHAALRRAGIVAAACAAGFAWAASVAHWRLADALPEAWEGRDVEVVGVVASLPQRFERGLRFEFTPERVLTAGASVPSRIHVGWYGGFGADSADAPPPLRPGERWLLNLRLKRPHGGANPHGFDDEAWLLERGIRATGYVRPPRAETRPRLLSEFAWSPGAAVDRMRESIRDRLARALADAPHGGVITALAIGDQRAIDSDDWQVFTRTGVGHLMSISGLHVTMVASLGAFIALLLWRRSERLMLTLAAPRAAALAGIFTALAYCLLAGFAVPAQRTLYMLAVAAWSVWRGWSGSGTRVLAIALGVVCLLDPWAPLSPGFWLSFAAVGTLLLAAGGLVGRTHWLKAALTAQVAVTVGLLPLTIALFQQVSIAGPLANALAIPVVSFVVTPLALLASIAPFDAPAQLAHLVLGWLMTYLQWLSSFEWAVWQRAAPPWWTVLLAVAGTLWCMLPWWLHWRALGAIWLLPLLTHPAPAPPAGDLWLTVLDVGQGLAVVARTASHTLVFDAGPQYSPEADGGNRVVVPFLRGEGVKRLDTLVVSHDDNDHSGGAASIMGAVDTGELLSPFPPGHRLLSHASRQRRCVAGESWTWDGVEFSFLHPPATDYERGAGLKDNALGCVLAIRAHGRRLLLPADIERDVEAALVASGQSLRSEVLVVPHHGSRTSSTEAFLAATAPQLAIVAAGYRNRFRHPSPEVMARYAARGTAVRRTDLSGAITVRVAATGLQVDAWREVRERYWQGR